MLINHQPANSWKIFPLVTMKLLLGIWLFGAFCSSHVTFGDEIPYNDKILDVNNRFLQEYFPNSSFLMEGDIIKKKSISMFSPRVLKWPKINGFVIIPYILSVNYEPFYLKVIMEAFNDVQNSTCLRFKRRTNERDYIAIEPAMGCFSSVGRSGGMQLVSLAFDCLKGDRGKGVVLHELLHVAGFWHEHSRADRDDYIHVSWDQIKDGYERNFCRYETNNLIVGYDPGSLLHYSRGTNWDPTLFAFIYDHEGKVNGFPISSDCHMRYAFSKSGQPTITPIGRYSGVEIGQRSKLSASDLLRINKFYSCPQYEPSQGEDEKIFDFPPSFYSCEKSDTNVHDYSKIQEGSTQNATGLVPVSGSAKEPMSHLPPTHILGSTPDYSGISILPPRHVVTSSQSFLNAYMQSPASASTSSSQTSSLEGSTEEHRIGLAPNLISSSEKSSLKETISSQAPTTAVSEQTSAIVLNTHIILAKSEKLKEKLNEGEFNNTSTLEVGGTLSSGIQSQTDKIPSPTLGIMEEHRITTLTTSKKDLLHTSTGSPVTLTGLLTRQSSQTMDRNVPSTVMYITATSSRSVTSSVSQRINEGSTQDLLVNMVSDISGHIATKIVSPVSTGEIPVLITNGTESSTTTTGPQSRSSPTVLDVRTEAIPTNLYEGPNTSGLLSRNSTGGFTHDTTFNIVSEIPNHADTVKVVPVAFSEPPELISTNTESPVTLVGPQNGSTQMVGVRNVTPTSMYKGLTTSSAQSSAPQNITAGSIKDLFNIASGIPDHADTVKVVPVAFSEPPELISTNTESPVTLVGPQNGSTQMVGVKNVTPTSMYKGLTTSSAQSSEPQNITAGSIQDLFNIVSGIPDHAETINALPVTSSPARSEEAATSERVLLSEHHGFGDLSPPVATKIPSLEQRSTTSQNIVLTATTAEMPLASILVVETPVTPISANVLKPQSEVGQTTSASDHNIFKVNECTLLCGTLSEKVNLHTTTKKTTLPMNVPTTSGDIFSGQLENELDKGLNAEFLKLVGKRSLPDVLPVSKSVKTIRFNKFSDWMPSKPKAQKISIIKSLIVHKRPLFNKRALLERPQKQKFTVYQILNPSHSIAVSKYIHDRTTPETYTMKSNVSTLHSQRNDSILLFSNGLRPNHSILQKIPNNKTPRHSQFCGFELGLCGWQESNDDNVDWMPTINRKDLHGGSGLLFDIPRGVHLSLRNFSKHLAPGQKAILLSPIHNHTNCISFWYGSLKHRMGTLNVYTRPADILGDWTLVWSKKGRTRVAWTKAKIQLLAPYSQMPMQVALEGIASLSSESNIVLDNLYTGKCR